MRRRLLHVPYKGSTQAHPDLIGGQVHIMFDTIVANTPAAFRDQIRVEIAKYRKVIQDAKIKVD